MRSIRRRLGGLSRPARGVAVLGSAAAVSQGILLAVSPVLARIYPPGDYGSFFIASSLGSILSAGLALRLELAVPLPRSDDRVRELVGMAMASAVGLSILALMAILLVGDQLALAAGLGNRFGLLCLVPVMGTSIALLAVMNAVAVRENRYRDIAVRQLAVGGLTAGLQVGFGFGGGGVVGLMLASIIGQCVGILLLLRNSRVMIGSGARVGEFFSLQTLSRYRRFPLLLAPAGWINILGSGSPVVLFGILYSSGEAGWFGLMVRVVAAPSIVIGTAVAQVYLGEISSRRRDGSGSELSFFLRSSKALLWLALVVGIAIGVCAPWVFEFVFGPQWRVSGLMAQAFALAAAAQLLVSPLSQTLIVFERIKLQVCWDVVRLLSTAGSILAAERLGCTAVQTVWILSLVTLVVYAANWVMCYATVARLAQIER